jgi:hypothetical protein
VTVTKIGELLAREGVGVPYRTLHRFAVECCGFTGGRGGVTVRVDDGEPGAELQVDFGDLGMIPHESARRLLRALVFTAVFSRYCFVYLTFSQTVEEVIAGCEEAWAFFGGVFKVIVPEYVARHIFRVLCPIALCGRWRSEPGDLGDRGRHRPHNDQSEASQLRSDSSDRQITLVRDAAEVPGGSTARRAASFVLVLISA